MLQLGGSGGMLLGRSLEFRGYKIASETILAQCDASWRQDNRVSHVWISTLSAHCVVSSTAFGFPCIQHPFAVLRAHPHALLSVSAKSAASKISE